MTIWKVLLIVLFYPFCIWAQPAVPGNIIDQPGENEVHQQIIARLQKAGWNIANKTTNGTIQYTIPVVVHVLENTTSPTVSDANIAAMIQSANDHFLETTHDTAFIIDKYKALATNTGIAFRLATIDPSGNPTKGIEHIYTYLATPLTNSLTDMSKVNQWPPSRYLNIWVMHLYDYPNFVGSNPYMAAVAPWHDGIALNYSLANYNNTISFLLAHYALGLPFTCGYGPSCTDEDGIPDTPPCSEDLLYCNVYDSLCDTPNVQNITAPIGVDCRIMFTYGQAMYLHEVLGMDIGKRDSLVTPHNNVVTGMSNAQPDLPMVCQYLVRPYYSSRIQSFFYPGQRVKFINRSWNDTITSVHWNFSNSPDSAISIAPNPANSFHEPGWVTLSLSVTGNHTSTVTRTDTNTVYIADSVATIPSGYLQEFVPGTFDKWPTFNYYNNSFKWEAADYGYNDGHCMRYSGFDMRNYPDNTTGMPYGDLDDMFSPVFDLTGVGSSCYLNFMSSGAARSLPAYRLRDTLAIYYSTDLAQTWQLLTSIGDTQLYNKGIVTIPYAPLWTGDWVPRTLLLPSAAITPHTIFRFQFRPGADMAGYSISNNFYIDRISFDNKPVTVADIEQPVHKLFLYPVPAIAGNDITVGVGEDIVDAAVTVTDVTGKVLIKLRRPLLQSHDNIVLPGTLLPATGLYIVSLTAPGINEVQKLIVY